MTTSPDFQGIELFLDRDPLLKKLYEEHRHLKKQIAKLEKKPFLTSQEEREEHQLKKQKLAGKDQIIRILEKHRRG